MQQSNYQMKKSIAYLPATNQADFRHIADAIMTRIKQTEMIILFGSYARNDFVVYDERFEFGKLQSYLSDYDILVVTSGISDGVATKALDNIEDLYYSKAQDPDKQPPLQFISTDVKKLNKELSEGRYFYTQIKQEGVVLYNSGRFDLARRRKLNYSEIKQQAEEYFNDKYQRGRSFLKGGVFYMIEADYKMSSFMLHQACENFFYTIRLVFTLQNSKQHNLSKLLNSVKKYSQELINLFPQNSPEEVRLFNLIKAAYVNGRYDPDFIVTKEDIEALMPKVEMLGEVTKRICEERILAYK